MLVEKTITLGYERSVLEKKVEERTFEFSSGRQSVLVLEYLNLRFNQAISQWSLQKLVCFGFFVASNTRERRLKRFHVTCYSD